MNDKLLERAKEYAIELVPHVFSNLTDTDMEVDIVFDEVAANYIFENKIDDPEELLAISKAGTFIRYCSDELIKARMDSSAVDIVKIVVDGIDRKIEEDTVHPEDEAEVEKLIAETEDTINELEEEIGEDEEDLREESFSLETEETEA